MIDNHHYKSISKKEKGAMTEICHYDSYSEYLKVFGKRKDFYDITFIESDESGEGMPLRFIEGELQKPQQQEEKPTPNKSTFDLGETLKKISEAAPSRGNNSVELLFDLMLGEDISKPKVSVIRGGKK